MKKIIAITLIILLSGVLATVKSQDGLGGVPGSYLFMGVDARALGMGGAYTAVANDATAVYWNPAGLASLNPFQVSLMHAILFVDSSLDFLAASAPTGNFGSFGVGVLALSSEDFEQRTDINEVVGNFSTRDLAFLLSWSKEITGGLSVGMNYKLVNQKILTYSGNGHGIDLGIKATLFRNFGAGLVFRNLLNPKMQIATATQNIPMQISAGLSGAFLNDNLIVSLEYAKIQGWGKGSWRLGGEYKLMGQSAVRIGMSENSFTFGAGIAFNAFGVNYSNLGNADLGSSHRFSLTYSFGGFGLGASAHPRVFSPSGEHNITRIKLKVKSRSEISDWFFAIVDREGRVVRQFKQSGQPPAELIWDGTNSMGAFVPDGSFNYLFNTNMAEGKSLTCEGQLVRIDSTGPAGFFASESEKE